MAAFHGFDNRVEVVDVALDHGVSGQRLNGITFEAVDPFAGVRDLDHFDGRRADIGADQWRHLGLEQTLDGVKVKAEFSFSHMFLARTPHNSL